MSRRTRIKRSRKSGQINLAIPIPRDGVKLTLSRLNHVGFLGTLILTETGLSFKTPKEKNHLGEIPWSAMPSLEPWYRQKETNKPEIPTRKPGVPSRQQTYEILRKRSLQLQNKEDDQHE